MFILNMNTTLHRSKVTDKIKVCGRTDRQTRTHTHIQMDGQTDTQTYPNIQDIKKQGLKSSRIQIEQKYILTLKHALNSHVEVVRAVNVELQRPGCHAKVHYSILNTPII